MTMKNVKLVLLFLVASIVIACNGEKDVCAGHKCPKGQVCLPHLVNCVTRPNCPTKPECVPAEQEEEDVCKGHECPAGEICQPQVVNCVKAPCPPLPECIPDLCARVRCRNGKCVASNGMAECVPNEEEPNACATVRCKAGYHCEEENGNAKCVSDSPKLTCATVKCRGGYECVMKNGKPRCIPDVSIDPEINACAAVLCMEGFQCKETLGKARCLPINPPTPGNEGCNCPMVYQPVCGTNGVTYGNKCLLGCSGVVMDYEGECGSDSGTKE